MPDHTELYQRFRALHSQDHAFDILNPWDAGPARILTMVGFEALAAHLRGPLGGVCSVSCSGLALGSWSRV